MFLELNGFRLLLQSILVAEPQVSQRNLLIDDVFWSGIPAEKSILVELFRFLNDSFRNRPLEVRKNSRIHIFFGNSFG